MLREVLNKYLAVEINSTLTDLIPLFTMICIMASRTRFSVVKIHKNIPLGHSYFKCSGYFFISFYCFYDKMKTLENESKLQSGVR